MTDGVDCSHDDPCDTTADHVYRRAREIAREEAEKIVEERLREIERNASQEGSR